MKKLILLNGVTSGTVNPLAAVAMDGNKRMSGTDALVVSSLGNSNAATMLAFSGGFGGNSGSGGGNAMNTLLMASALQPKKDGDSSSGSDNTLNTLATMSVLGGMSNNGGNGNGLFGGGW